MHSDTGLVVVIVAGLIFYLRLIIIQQQRMLIPFSLAQSYWWIPLAIGIIAFSWGFK